MTGGCHCGQVRYDLTPPLRGVIACHCTQCRKSSGHFWAATSVPMTGFRLVTDDGLVWFRSSSKAQRGFCKSCGSSLFYELLGQGRISIGAGTLDGPTGLAVISNWFTEDAADYYHASRQPSPNRSNPSQLSASCLCGANHFTMPGPAGNVTACHCVQCRKISGHFSASFDANEAKVHWLSKASVAEYCTQGGGVRGFCKLCGSSLYFRNDDGFAVEGGVVNGPTGGKLTNHVFTGEKGDYYTLSARIPGDKLCD